MSSSDFIINYLDYFIFNVKAKISEVFVSISYIKLTKI